MWADIRHYTLTASLMRGSWEPFCFIYYLVSFLANVLHLYGSLGMGTWPHTLQSFLMDSLAFVAGFIS